jgi:hypothetical protein
MTEGSRDGAASERPETDRADRVSGEADSNAEEWGERIGRWVLAAGARVREEAEDIWAEAQTLRRDV